jgi:hypothetical protein
MPTYDGNLLTLDLDITVFGVVIKVAGTIEVLNVRRRVNAPT